MVIVQKISQPTRAPERIKPLSIEERGSLIELGTILESEIPWLIRVIASRGDQVSTDQNRDIFRSGTTDLVQVNKKRRSGRSLLVHLFKGEVDDYFLTTLRGTMLPILLGKRTGEEPVHAGMLLEFIQGLLTGCLFSEFQENLVPHARMQAAMIRAFQLMAE